MLLISLVPSIGVNRNGGVNRNKTQKSFSDLNFSNIKNHMNNFVFQGDRGCQQCVEDTFSDRKWEWWGLGGFTYIVPKIFGKKVLVRTLPPTSQPHKEMLQPCIRIEFMIPHVHGKIYNLISLNIFSIFRFLYFSNFCHLFRGQ